MNFKHFMLFFIVLLFIVVILLSFVDIQVDAGMDKVYHFITFFALSFLVIIYFNMITKNNIKFFGYLNFVYILSIGLIAAISEKIQEFNVRRSCDVMDWLADIGGASFALICIYTYKLYTNKQKK